MHSQFCSLQSEKGKYDTFFTLNVRYQCFKILDVLVQKAQFLQKLAFFGFVCFLIFQIFPCCVPVRIRCLVTARTISSKPYTFHYNARKRIFIAISRSIDWRLSKATEASQWISLNKATSLDAF